MFFNITTQADTNFPNQQYFNNLCLNTDNGWKLKEDLGKIYVYKGLSFDFELADILDCNSGEHYGSFCIIEYNKHKQDLTVKTDRHRAFTIYTDNSQYTNLYKLPTAIWADDTITIDQNFCLSNKHHDPVGKIDNTITDYKQVVDWIYNRLYERIQAFVNTNKLPIKVFLSGGVDSMLIYSFIKKLTNNYELVFEETVQYDYFYMANSDTIKHSLPLGTQMHHWRDSCVIISGAPGDEFLMRNPILSQLWCDWHDLDLMQVIEENTNAYMYKFFKKNLRPLSQDKSLSGLTQTQLLHHLCNINVNDPQHWHIGNTFMFTPLRDIEIYKKIAMLPAEQGLLQILHAQINKDIIARNDAELLNYVSTYKNFESRKRLIPFYNMYSNVTSTCR